MANSYEYLLDLSQDERNAIMEDCCIEWDAEDRCATESEACDEFARNVGRDDTTRAWILTPFDSWERNPFYRGPAVRHPEDYDYED